MKKILIPVAALAVLAALLAFTCPGSAKHRDALIKGLRTMVNERPESPSEGEFAGAVMLRSPILAEIVTNTIEGRLDVEKHFLYSRGIIDNYNDSWTVTTGILGCVFINYDNLGTAVEKIATEF